MEPRLHGTEGGMGVMRTLGPRESRLACPGDKVPLQLCKLKGTTLCAVLEQELSVQTARHLLHSKKT